MAAAHPAPLRIPQPSTVEEAHRIVVGAKVAIRWSGEHEGWYEAEVVEVYSNDDDATHPPGPFQVKVFYPAQHGYDDDGEDKDWQDVFDADDAELLELPVLGQLAFPYFVPPGAAARSRQPREAAAAPAVHAEAAAPAAHAGGRAAVGSPGKRGRRPNAGDSNGEEWRPGKRARSSGKGGGSGSRRTREADDDEGDDEAGPSGRPARQAQRAQHATQGLYAEVDNDDEDEEEEEEWAPMNLLQQESSQPPPLHPQQAQQAQQQAQQQQQQQAQQAQAQQQRLNWQQQRAGGSQRNGPAHGKGAQLVGSQRPSLLHRHVGLASPGGSGRSGGGGGAGAYVAHGVAQPRQQPQRQRARVPRVMADHSGVPDPVGAPRAGTIKRLELWNFMCHRRLQMDFNPHVNMLSGSNGSGKSAVLGALQCCLGARASDTGRYSSHAKNVMRGESQAQIKVTLWNTGPDAYRRADLGPMLTVVRKINATGGGTHSVEDHTGRTVFTGTLKVRELVEELCINAANPAIVLVQEMAKSFAAQQSEGAKYEGFMQATQFDRIKAYLQDSNNHISQVEGLVAGLAAHVDRLAARQAEQEEKLEQLKEVGTWQRDCDDLSRVLIWAPFHGTEKAVAKLREVVDHDLPAELASCQQRVASYAQQRTVLNTQYEEQGQALRDIDAAARGFGAQKATVKAAVKEKKGEVAQLRRELEQKRRELGDAEAEKAELEAAAQNVDDEFVRSTQQQAGEHRQRVAACRDRCERAKVASTNAREHLAEREAAVEQAREDERAATAALRNGRQQVAQLEQDLQRLQEAQKAPLANFGGPGALELHQAIQAAAAQGRFTAPPIHIGSSVSLADGTWATAVEAAVGRRLNDWIVNDQRDLQVIKTLRSRLSRQPFGVSFVVMAFRHPAHRIPPGRQPPEDVATLLRVLRFAEGPHSHVVQNVLIDHASIERTVLVNTREDAVAMVRDKPFWNRYHLATAYAKDGCRAYARGLSEVSAPPDKYLRPRLVRDLSQQVADCRRDLQEAEAALGLLQEAQAQKHRQAVEAGRQLAAAKEEHRSAVAHKQTADTQYQEALTHQPATPEAGGAAGGSEAAQRLARLNRLIADSETQVDGGEDLLRAATGELERLQQRQHAAQAAPAEHVDQAAAAAAAIAETAAEMKEVQALYDGAVAEDKLLQQYLAKGRERLQVLERDLAQLLANAEEVCTRDEEAAGRARLVAAWRDKGQSEEEVETMLEQGRLARRVEALQRKIGKRTADAGIGLKDLELELDRVRQKRWKQDLRLEQAEQVLAMCKEGYERRRKCFRRLRSCVADNVSKQFRRYMSMRGHRGEVEVDYQPKGGRLALCVGIGGAELTKDMRALSGGERSLASLAFVLALGSAGVQPPFHALDEFDVFMDSINRRMALAFLLEFAMTHTDRQMLLLTPQDISVLEEARHQVEVKLKRAIPEGFVSVQRMWPPREQQAVSPAS